jgi:hypothetical protein
MELKQIVAFILFIALMLCVSMANAYPGQGMYKYCVVMQESQPETVEEKITVAWANGACMGVITVEHEDIQVIESSQPSSSHIKLSNIMAQVQKILKEFPVAREWSSYYITMTAVAYLADWLPGATQAEVVDWIKGHITQLKAQRAEEVTL